MVEEDIKRKIIGILSTLFPSAKIYLFGSHATGKAGETSDIDLAIDNGSCIRPEDLDEARSLMRALAIPISVDIVDLVKVSPAFRAVIDKEKILWKS